MSYRVLTDANGDLTPELAAQMSMDAVPMAFIFNGVEYLHHLDARNMDISEFYGKLRSGEMVTTAAINPAQWMDYMRPIVEAGDDLLVIAFSSGLSTTYNSAVITAQELLEEFPERKILVVDSLCAAMGEGLLCYMVHQKVAAGASLEEAAQYAEDLKLHIIHWFTVDDLNFLKRGGRISGAAAAVGTLLQVKPILNVTEEGKLASVGKARGRKAALNELVAKAKEFAIDPSQHPMFISHGDCLADAEYVKAQLMEKLGVPEVFLNTIGPPVGAHSGPGTVALGFYGTTR